MTPFPDAVKGITRQNRQNLARIAQVLPLQVLFQSSSMCNQLYGRGRTHEDWEGRPCTVDNLLGHRFFQNQNSSQGSRSMKFISFFSLLQVRSCPGNLQVYSLRYYGILSGVPMLKRISPWTRPIFCEIYGPWYEVLIALILVIESWLSSIFEFIPLFGPRIREASTADSTFGYPLRASEQNPFCKTDRNSPRRASQTTEFGYYDLISAEIYMIRLESCMKARDRSDAA